MHILIYGINYTPELTGIGKYTGEMAEWLAMQGHDVRVITAMPFYPEWKIRDSYKKRKWFTEKISGVTVHRSPLYVPKNVNSRNRIIHDFSFIISSFFYWFKYLFMPKADIVFCVAPPFHLGILPLIYSKLRGVPIISHIQDLQIDVANELGMIRNKALLKLMFALERFILRNSTKVSTISLGMAQKIAAKGVAPERQIQLPNWVDETHIKPLPKKQSLRSELGIGMSDKVVLYSGNLGEKQGLESIIEVAEKYKHRDDVFFLIVGTGAIKEKLRQRAFDANLKQVRFYPLQPYEKLSALLATADVHLVLQKKSAADLVMPSKLTGILAAGGCVIVTAEPETSLYSEVHKHNMGIICEPENTASLALAINTAIETTNVEIYRNNARKYAEQFLSKKSILSKFEDLLIELHQQ